MTENFQRIDERLDNVEKEILKQDNKLNRLDEKVDMLIADSGGMLKVLKNLEGFFNTLYGLKAPMQWLAALFSFIGAGYLIVKKVFLGE